MFKGWTGTVGSVCQARGIFFLKRNFVVEMQPTSDFRSLIIKKYFIALQLLGNLNLNENDILSFERLKSVAENGVLGSLLDLSFDCGQKVTNRYSVSYV